MTIERDDDFWRGLAGREWRRVKWRRGRAGLTSERCAAYGTPIHRRGTYYLRPVYTDGTQWLSQRAYEEMIRRVEGRSPSRRYGRRTHGSDDAS